MFLFCKGENANFILWQETHTKLEDEKLWMNQWEGKIMFDHGYMVVNQWHLDLVIMGTGLTVF